MLISPNRNGTVQYGSISTHFLGPVLCGGGGGAGSHSFACWSALEVILFSQSFHFLLDPEYRVSTANHKRCSVSAGMWFGQLYFLPVKGVCRTLILFQRMILVNLKPNPNKTHIYIYLEEDSVFVSLSDCPEIVYIAILSSDIFSSLDRGHNPRNGIWNDP